ncbi:tetratricopeptide repeat protein (macronuclear) [Tetrahymena thermophila SB210]|uniref:Tetratricopeptide repeat protein n=1 Tax=Tetrahymena thermophila (strain SB210) TaxID=312017 RepID=I7M619_TETTS|nr:tetratricopeptide repeat protein [Tetrahymena thermophila SB210]EAR84044.1 tetratricopeptide repeat protein [Tetrahymena thermophila SB210]|eukprot:XP_001031707.1 tetratricopeptide repeat protein [Tetrahymena thermophila SB210]
MEQYIQLFQESANYHSEVMKEQRKKFESKPQFIRAGLYYFQKFQEMHHQQIQQKYFASELLKISGNQKFKNQEYEQACVLYEQALSIFRFVRNKRENWQKEGLYDDDLEYVDENGKSDKEKKLVKGLKVVLYQNICLVYLKLSKNNCQNVNDALYACNEAIKLDQKSSKAYYLRAKARLDKVALNNEDFKQSIKDYKRALELDPDNQNIQQQLQKCIIAFDKIKQIDFSQPFNSNKQTQREERCFIADCQAANGLNSNFQVNMVKNNERKTVQQMQINDKDKKKKSQKNDNIDEQTNKTQDLWNQLRIEKTFLNQNISLNYEIIQKTVI